MVDLGDRRRLALVVVVTLAGMLITSIGYAAVTVNPTVPRPSTTASDAEQPYMLNRSGTVNMTFVEHTGGDPANLSELQVIVGSRRDGFVFDRDSNWSVERFGVTFELLLNGAPIADDDRFVPGDRLMVAKTEGQMAPGGEFSVRVRLVHVPSRTTITDETVLVQ